MTQTELQLEGLVGASHNYAGLSHGNIASTANANAVSNPRAAALQSLDKMQFVASLGVPVAIMPPHPRPHLDVLSRLGYSGKSAEMLQAAWDETPELVASIYSASSMWSANAATVAPSADTADKRVHFTPANLISTLHRSIETRTTTHYLRQIFAHPDHFTVHDALPVTTRLADEGAANHMRLCGENETVGTHIFVYGASPASSYFPAHFPARQQQAASETVARMHQLSREHVIYIQQNPDAIDAGVFHNDVIAMSHGNLLIYHAQAYIDTSSLLAALPPTVQCREITESELSLPDTVSTYFFNAQLIGLPAGGVALLLPQECATHPQAKKLADSLLAEPNPIREIHYLNLRESMRNGGGPACLRLRVPLTESELAAIHQGVRYTPALHERLAEFITRRYRNALTPADLQHPALAEELLTTHQDLMQLLGLSLT